MAWDLSGALPILKEWYTPKKVEELTFASSAYGMMPKISNLEGDTLNGAIKLALGSNGSADDTVAFTSTGAPQYDRWKVPIKSWYTSKPVRGEVIDRTATTRGAFVQAITALTDDAYREFGQQTGASIWGNGGGAIGQISADSDVSSTVVRLANPSDAINYWPGQVLQASVTDGTSGAVKTGTVTIAKTNIDTGELTATTAWNASITLLAAGDYLFRRGNFGAVFQGIPAWIPTQSARDAGALVPTFNNVDRTVDPIRLAGSSVVGNGAPYEQTLIKLATRIQRNMGRPTHAFLNDIDYGQLVTSLGSRVQYMTESAFKNAQIAFQGVTLATPVGMIKIMLDPFVPQGNAWMLDISSWEFASVGQYPYNKMQDNPIWPIEPGEDAYRYRLLGRGVCWCSKPFANGVATF